MANHEHQSDCTTTSFTSTDNTMLHHITNPNPARTRMLLSNLPRLKISPFEGPKFILFPQLPIELRNKIWRHVSKFPQTINLYSIGRWKDMKGSVPEFYSIPPVLHASSESRAEALRHYQLVMHKIEKGCTFDNTINSYVSTWKDRWVYINFKVDRLVQSNILRPFFIPDFFLPFQSHYLSQIRFLDIEFYGQHDLIPENQIVEYMLGKVKLEMITLVECPIPGWEENYVVESVGGHLMFNETKQALLKKWASTWAPLMEKSGWSPRVGTRLIVSEDVELDPSRMDDSL